MITPQIFLSRLGFSQKEVGVYLTLLRRGPSSVRQLASAADVNRGTTYDILKSLQDQGLVSYYEKKKKTYFVAQEPKTLTGLVKQRKEEAQTLEEDLKAVLPELSSIAVVGEKAKPVARYFHGAKGVKSILEEVLSDMAQCENKHYYVYSSATISNHLYEAIPDFTKQRIKSGIEVSVISLGAGGTNGEELSHRRWLNKDDAAPTYTIVFCDKSAFISLDESNHPQGVIITDKNLANTETILFESLWKTLTDES
jgi:HTH-type transcriptional regulator, sugar sensing transcriptional regulator